MNILAKEVCEKLMKRFPKEISLAFAYGSGVFQQANSANLKNNMIDLMIIVDNPVQWHAENLQRNKADYSGLRFLGARRIAKIQDQYAARIYFNTLVQAGDHLIKYGVLSTNSLTSDLLDWDNLYVAGRLHKPVLEIVHKDIGELRPSLNTNLCSAVHAALLTLPETFSEQQLFERIASLSYTGDARMALSAEDPNKVSKIVGSQIERFRDLYAPILEAEDHIYWSRASGHLEQLMDDRYRLHHMSLLPCNVQVQLVKLVGDRSRYSDAEEILRQLSGDPSCPKLVTKAVSNIVQTSSWPQTVKGFFTAGLMKSLRYGGAKLRKGLSFGSEKE